MQFTFTEITLEILEMYDALTVVIDETGFTEPPKEWETAVSLDWDRNAIEIFWPRDNGPDLLINPIIPDVDWPKIFQELETLNFDEVDEYLDDCERLNNWVRDPKDD